MCEKRQATVICCADEATLCAKCDVEVHAANKLASKHQRIQLHTLSTKLPTCDICQVLLIGGSTGTMVEALEVVGDDHEVNLGEEMRFQQGMMIHEDALWEEKF